MKNTTVKCGCGRVAFLTENDYVCLPCERVWPAKRFRGSPEKMEKWCMACKRNQRRCAWAIRNTVRDNPKWIVVNDKAYCIEFRRRGVDPDQMLLY